MQANPSRSVFGLSLARPLDARLEPTASWSKEPPSKHYGPGWADILCPSRKKAQGSLKRPIPFLAQAGNCWSSKEETKDALSPTKYRPSPSHNPPPRKGSPSSLAPCSSCLCSSPPSCHLWYHRRLDGRLPDKVSSTNAEALPA